MSVTAAQFTSDFPEFASSPPAQIAFWLNYAAVLLTSRWGPSAADPWPTTAPFPALTLYDIGTELLVAHNLALEAAAVQDGASGGIPGSTVGPTSSMSVDKVSVSSDNNVATYKNAGDFNLTSYGIRFMRLLRMVGAGALEVNVGCSYPFLNGPAWYGPTVDQGSGF